MLILPLRIEATLADGKPKVTALRNSVPQSLHKPELPITLGHHVPTRRHDVDAAQMSLRGKLCHTTIELIIVNVEHIDRAAGGGHIPSISTVLLRAPDCLVY